MECKPGEIVLIPFPYSDLSTTKKRPVLALTLPDKNGDFIALAVTSVETPEYAVKLENLALTAGNLPKPSWVRVDKIFTLSTSSIIKVFGTLKSDVFQMVLDGLCRRVGYAKHA